MSTLDDIIDKSENLECKRAVAVKMFISNFNTKDICDLLNVSDSFVSKWKIIYENEGAGGLKIKYEGGKGFLTEDQRYEIIMYLKQQSHYNVEQLTDFIERHYGVVYTSKQSYYDLLKAGGLSWHQTQPMNPKRDPEQVATRREEIKAELKEHQEEIVKGETLVFFQDEVHTIWEDVVGDTWCRKNERAEVPVANPKERQTYYGVLNLQNQEVSMMPYQTGNGKNTVDFLEYLESVNKGKKIIIIWDNSTCHYNKKVQQHLEEVNQNLAKKDWKVTCIPFAPYAPEQNPIEDVWLQGKNFLRRHFFENKTFSQVKASFFNFLNKRIFDLEKPHWYFEIPQPV